MTTAKVVLRRRLLISALLVCVGAWLALLWLEDSYREQSYARIEPGLYLGESVPNPPPGTQAVVNLCGRKDSYPAEAVLWEPILEGGREEPSVEWLRRVVGFITEQRRAGRNTYVHCLAGVNRSAMVVTAYLMSEHGWGRDEALAFVRSRRPQARPNPSLMSLLAEWEQTLTRERAAGGM